MTDPATLQELAKRHLMMHFTSHGRYDSEDVPIISRGEGCWLWDTNGKRYFDGMSGLFCTQIGHSFGAELGEAAAKQMAELPFFINWSYAHPRVIELSAKIAELAPGDLNRMFFCSGGSEANDSIIKLVRQYHQIRGEHHRYKMIARRLAYHGTTLGALSLTGIAAIKAPFEPLLPGVRHVSNTNAYRRPDGETAAEFTAFLLDELRGVIEQEGPHSIAAVFMEPVQNSGGTLHSAGGLLPGRARDLRRVRHPARGRRGHLRVRPARVLVRVGALRHPPRHHHLRQGHRLGPRAARRRAHDRPGRRPVRQPAHTCSRMGSPTAATRCRPRSRSRTSR